MYVLPNWAMSDQAQTVMHGRSYLSLYACPHAMRRVLPLGTLGCIIRGTALDIVCWCHWQCLMDAVILTALDRCCEHSFSTMIERWLHAAAIESGARTVYQQQPDTAAPAGESRSSCSHPGMLWLPCRKYFVLCFFPMDLRLLTWS